MLPKRTIILFILAGLVVFAFLRLGNMSLPGLRGSLLSDHVIETSLKQRADTNGDHLLSVQEIRTVLVHIIRHVITGDSQEDINGDAAVDHGDITATVRGFRALLVAVPGNGIVEAGEECDDGNATDGDGCSSTCQIEQGYVCVAEPSLCNPSCGDGLIRGSETCDDNNTANGDGCAATCTVESGYSCTGEPSVCTQLSTNLDAYWKFDETSGDRDRIASVGSYDLSDLGGFLPSIAGIIGNAAAIPTGVSLSNVNDVITNNNRSFSLAFWVMIDNPNLTNTSEEIVRSMRLEAPHVDQWSVIYDRTHNVFVFSIDDTSIARASNFGMAGAGDWNLVVVTFDKPSLNMSISVNGGTPNVTHLSVNPLGNATSGFNRLTMIGNDNYAIDEMGMWSRVLTSGEIQRLYNSGAGVTTPFN